MPDIHEVVVTSAFTFNHPGFNFSSDEEFENAQREISDQMNEKLRNLVRNYLLENNLAVAEYTIALDQRNGEIVALLYKKNKSNESRGNPSLKGAYCERMKKKEDNSN